MTGLRGPGSVLESVRGSDSTDVGAAATWQAVEHRRNTALPLMRSPWHGDARERASIADGLTLEELRETRTAAVLHEMEPHM
jgi:hypothetical protein